MKSLGFLQCQHVFGAAVDPTRPDYSATNQRKDDNQKNDNNRQRPSNNGSVNLSIQTNGQHISTVGSYQTQTSSGVQLGVHGAAHSSGSGEIGISIATKI